MIAARMEDLFRKKQEAPPAETVATVIRRMAEFGSKDILTIVPKLYLPLFLLNKGSLFCHFEFCIKQGESSNHHHDFIPAKEIIRWL